MKVNLDKWKNEKSLVPLGPDKYGYLNKEQKIAVFLISIGIEKAIKVFNNLPEEDKENVVRELYRMEYVNPETVKAILDELDTTCEQPCFKGGIEYVRELLKSSYTKDKADRILRNIEVTSKTGSDIFQKLANLDPVQLGLLLQKELPQTAALVLSYLDPETAAKILSNFPEDLRSQVSMRMIKTKEINIEILNDLIEGLIEKYSKYISDKNNIKKIGGIDVLVKILNQLDEEVKNNILNRIENHDPLLSQSIKDKLFVFDDLVFLTDNAIRIIIQKLDITDLAKALKIANDQIRFKIFNNMSQNLGRLLREEMNSLPPLHIKEIKQKQDEIVSIVKQLEQEGKIIISRKQDEIIL